MALFFISFLFLVVGLPPDSKCAHRFLLDVSLLLLLIFWLMSKPCLRARCLLCPHGRGRGRATHKARVVLRRALHLAALPPCSLTA